VVQPPSLIIGQKALGVVLSPQTVKSGSTDDDSLSNSNNSCNHKHVDSGGGGSSSRGGDSGVGLCGHTGYPDMHGGAHRSGPLRLKKHCNQLSNTGSSQQGPEEEGASVSPKVHLRLVRLVQCQEPKVSCSRSWMGTSSGCCPNAAMPSKSPTSIHGLSPTPRASHVGRSCRWLRARSVANFQLLKLSLRVCQHAFHAMSFIFFSFFYFYFKYFLFYF
jgi:hypothetical protein